MAASDTATDVSSLPASPGAAAPPSPSDDPSGNGLAGNGLSDDGLPADACTDTPVVTRRTASAPPLRVLFVSHSLPPADRPMSNVGGMQRVATKLYEALRTRPASEVELRPLLLRSTWRMTHVKTLPFLLKTLWTVRRLARAGAVDAVLFSSMVTATTAVPLQGLLQRAGVATAAIVHGRDVTLPTAPWQWFVPKVFAALDAVLPVSRATGAAAVARGLPPAKVHVVPNGIDLDRFAPPADRRTARTALSQALGDAAHPLPDDALLLCSVGRQVERKGFAWFAEHVMPRLPARVHYWLAGDGPEADTIRAAIARHDLHPRVRRLGRISEGDLARLYRGSDLFVMPNVPVPGDMEGFGIVMLEANQSGCPVVAARLEGIQDVVTEGANGHLVPSRDAGAFADAVLRYHDAPERLPAAAHAAYVHTTARFGWSSVTDRYLAVLRDLVTAKTA